MELIVCEYKGCINDLSKWDVAQILDDGTEECECPECGALHHIYRSSKDILYIKLVPDNG